MPHDEVLNHYNRSWSSGHDDVQHHLCNTSFNPVVELANGLCTTTHNLTTLLHKFTLDTVFGF